MDVQGRPCGMDALGRQLTAKRTARAAKGRPRTWAPDFARQGLATFRVATRRWRIDFVVRSCTIFPRESRA
jgi:hypothetical protein